jgi:cyclic pyranopterin phosphate synthase
MAAPVPVAERITDLKGRVIDYARISVTDRCNFRCMYCMPEEGVPNISHDGIMRYEEVLFLCGVLRDLGVRKIRFTGGEPLIRSGIIDFLSDFRNYFPGMALSLTTNASLLQKYAADLGQLGLSSLNVSLDTIDPKKFNRITRLGDLSSVLDGIASAKAAGISNIKTNTVLIRGFNDHELPRILDYAWRNGLSPRFIEFMPLGDNIWRNDKFIASDEILGLLTKVYGDWKPARDSPDGGENPLGPAKYYANGQNQTVGMIAAVSNHFCGTCNRLRIAASGNMRSCLFSGTETPLIDFLRRRDKDGTRWAILNGINSKPDVWENERDETRRMSAIGG